MSATKVDARVVICEIEKRGRMQGILCPPRPHQLTEATRKAPRPRRAEEGLRDHRPRAGAEPWARPGACADVEEPIDRRSVAGLLGERPPEEVLVERKRTGIRIASLQIDVARLKIGR